MYRVRPPELSRIEVSGSVSKAHLGDRTLFIDGSEITVPVYKKESLPPEVVIEGPCIIEGDTATTIVTRGFRARHDAFGNLILTPSRR
jgi:N-methylhydantoinase A